MKKLFLLFFFVFSAFAQTTYFVREVYELTINSSINPATLDYLKNAYKKAEETDSSLILIKMNTPGGLVTTTKDILTLIGESDTPTVVWITPEAASATSAGAIIASGAHFLFMSKGTNIGAATPVGLGKDIEESDGRSKMINDLTALTKSLSSARGRNGEAFAKMISEAKSYESTQALKENIINDILSNKTDLAAKLMDKKVFIKGTEFSLDTKNLTFIEVAMDMGQELLNTFANPSTAYILFIIGAALLYFEFQAPGGFIAGSVGVVFLILAGIGFQVLPLHLGAVGLIVLAFVLFILEIYITSYGVLTLGGLASLIFGSLFLFRGEDGYLNMSMDVIISTVSGITLYIGLIVWVFIKKRDQNHSDFFENENEFGQVTQVFAKDGELFQYQIKVQGEIWKAISDQPIQLGDKIKVTKQDSEHLRYHIQKV